MINLDIDNSVYDNLIEFYFHEYFELRNIDISGNNYKSVDNSLYGSAFEHVYNKLFKPDNTTIKYNNKNTKIDLNNIDEIEYIYKIYDKLCNDFNILPFQYMFLKLTGIDVTTLDSWYKEEYSHNGLSHRYSQIAKNVKSLPGQQTRNKLAGDRIGLQSLANNDQEVGLLYSRSEAFNKAVGSDAGRLTLDDLKQNSKFLTSH